MARFLTPRRLRFLGVLVLHGALAAGARSIGWVGALAPAPEAAAPIAVRFNPGNPPSAPSSAPFVRHAEPPPPEVELPPPPAVIPPAPALPEPPPTAESTDRSVRNTPATVERSAKPARPRPTSAAKESRRNRISEDSSVKTGRGDSAPVLVGSSAPTYPVAARMANIEGSVQVRATVDVRGQVNGTSLSRSSGHPELDAAALKAVRRWHFKPATRNGRPIAAETLVRVRFALR